MEKAYIVDSVYLLFFLDSFALMDAPCDTILKKIYNKPQGKQLSAHVTVTDPKFTTLPLRVTKVHFGPALRIM